MRICLSVLAIVALVPATILAKNLPVAETRIYGEEGDYIEGDLILTEDQKNGIPGDNYRWPNAIIYYDFEGIFASEPSHQDQITAAIADFEAKTCIRFQRYDGSQEDYVAITDAGSGCSSFVGRVGGRQTLNLDQPGCSRVGVAVHELMHASGFYHEHVRPDRDDYVVINWENIEPGKERNFEIRPTSLTFDSPYDYGSILHYSKTTFNIGESNTIDPKDPNAEIGQRIEMSPIDAAKLNAMYNCRKRLNF